MRSFAKLSKGMSVLGAAQQRQRGATPGQAGHSKGMARPGKAKAKLRAAGQRTAKASPCLAKHSKAKK